MQPLCSMHLTDWVQFLLPSLSQQLSFNDLSSRILVSGEKHPSRVFIFREHLFCDCIARNPRDSPLRSCNSFQVFTTRSKGSESPPISRALRTSLAQRSRPVSLPRKIEEKPEDGNPIVDEGRKRRRRKFNGRIGDVRVKVMLKREDENCRVLIDYKVTGLILDRLSA